MSLVPIVERDMFDLSLNELSLALVGTLGASASIRTLSSTQVADDIMDTSTSASITSALKVSRLATVGPVLLEGSIVLLKHGRDIVPPRSAQWLIVSKRNIGSIGLTGR